MCSSHRMGICSLLGSPAAKSTPVKQLEHETRSRPEFNLHDDSGKLSSFACACHTASVGKDSFSPSPVPCPGCAPSPNNSCKPLLYYLLFQSWNFSRLNNSHWIVCVLVKGRQWESKWAKLLHVDQGQLLTKENVFKELPGNRELQGRLATSFLWKSYSCCVPRAHAPHRPVSRDCWGMELCPILTLRTSWGFFVAFGFLETSPFWGLGRPHIRRG